MRRFSITDPRLAFARLLVGGAFAFLCSGRDVLAQDTVEVRNLRKAPLTISAGAAFNATFRAKNINAGARQARVSLSLPSGWQVIGGTGDAVVNAGAQDLLIFSINAARGTPAGRFVVQANIEGGQPDSLIVTIDEHREIEVIPLDAPGWVATGAPVAARFLVRNRGNVTSQVAFEGQSLQRLGVRTEPSAAALAPGATIIVVVSGAAPSTLARAVDDNLELRATDRADRAVTSKANFRTTFVPKGIVSERFATVPATVSVRGGGYAAGVSPVTIQGGGLMPDNNTTLSFNASAPTNRQSQFGFGEREEYRALFRNDHWRLRLGSDMFGYTPLTTGGFMGSGAQFDVTGRWFQGGAYIERPMWLLNSAPELGTRVGLPTALGWLYGTVVERGGDELTKSGVRSLSLEAPLPLSGFLQLESAESDSATQGGRATRLRVMGQNSRWSYNLGLTKADPNFTGPLRGGDVQEGYVEFHPIPKLSLTLNGGLRDWHPPFLPNAPTEQKSRNLSVAIGWGGIVSLEYGELTRLDRFESVIAVDGTQRTLRATASARFGAFSISAAAEHGEAIDLMKGAKSGYEAGSLSLRADFGSIGALNMYGSSSNGRTLSAGAAGILASGVNAQLHLPWRLDLQVSSSAQRATLGDYDGSGVWFGQSDIRLDRSFIDGTTIGVRAQLLQRASLYGTPNAAGYFLEVRRPIGMPTGPMREPGRAIGRIRDAATGAPVAGAMVRLGDQAAVTDDEGQVMFRGLTPGTHKVEIDGVMQMHGELLVGDVAVNLTKETKEPVRFAVSMMRGAGVRALVRRFDPAGGTVGSRADSLVDAGVISNVLVAIMSDRDTVYSASDDKGRIEFGTLRPGSYVLKIRDSEIPDHYVFAEEQIPVRVNAGQQVDIEFKVVPQRRTVTFVGPQSGSPKSELRLNPKQQKEFEKQQEQQQLEQRVQQSREQQQSAEPPRGGNAGPAGPGAQPRAGAGQSTAPRAEPKADPKADPKEDPKTPQTPQTPTPGTPGTPGTPATQTPQTP